MTGYLVPGLMAEAKSDERFLRPLIQRQLEAIGLEADFEVQEILTPGGSCRTVWAPDKVDAAVRELLEACHLVFVHHDRHESAKIDALRQRAGEQGRIIAVVPVRETEAWVIAALSSSARPNVNVDAIPRPLKHVEQDQDPKATLRRVLPEPMLLLEELGTTADLGVLKQLPAYQAFLDDLTSALKKELNYL